MANIKKFPIDCNEKCKYFACWDLSVDDLTCVCRKMNVQIDLCDSDFQRFICPLGIKVDEEVQNE